MSFFSSAPDWNIPEEVEPEESNQNLIPPHPHPRGDRRTRTNHLHRANSDPIRPTVITRDSLGRRIDRHGKVIIPRRRMVEPHHSLQEPIKEDPNSLFLSQSLLEESDNQELAFVHKEEQVIEEEEEENDEELRFSNLQAPELSDSQLYDSSFSFFSNDLPISRTTTNRFIREIISQTINENVSDQDIPLDLSSSDSPVKFDQELLTEPRPGLDHGKSQITRRRPLRPSADRGLVAK